MLRALKFLAPLGLLILTAQTCTVSAPAPTPPPSGPEARTFFNPRMNGAIVDTCSPRARNCGRRTAHRYCRRQGYRRSVRFDTRRARRTWIMVSNRYCRGRRCRGFRRVRCVR